jgi:hypothetical protein
MISISAPRKGSFSVGKIRKFCQQRHGVGWRRSVAVSDLRTCRRLASSPQEEVSMAHSYLTQGLLIAEKAG